MKIFLSKPHMSGNEQKNVKDAFDSNYIAPLGPHLDAFEDEVSKYIGNNLHCVGLSSGTAALHLALIVAGVEKGDEVWVSSMTFAGGVFPINYIGAKPRFFDLNPETWCINVDLVRDELKKAASENRLPKAIIPTDLYGQSVELDELESLVKDFDIALVVDSAESLGAEYLNGRKAGSGGDIAILSFNGNKIITTSGGGMIVTKNKDWADRARFLSTQARDKALHYEHSNIGFNYRLSNISAAIGLGQMKVLDKRVSERRNVFSIYEKALNIEGINFNSSGVSTDLTDGDGGFIKQTINQNINIGTQLYGFDFAGGAGYYFGWDPSENKSVWVGLGGQGSNYWNSRTPLRIVVTPSTIDLYQNTLSPNYLL